MAWCFWYQGKLFSGEYHKTLFVLSHHNGGLTQTRSCGTLVYIMTCGLQVTMVPVMACCLQATSHYLNQCWPSSTTSYGIIRDRCVYICNFSHRLSVLLQLHLPSPLNMSLQKTTSSQDEKHLSFEICCILYQRSYGKYTYKIGSLICVDGVTVPDIFSLWRTVTYY